MSAGQESADELNYKLTDEERMLAVPLAPPQPERDFSNTLGMKMICIGPGRYLGPDTSRSDWKKWEKLVEPFWISDSEVSVAQYFAFLSGQPGDQTPYYPEWLEADKPTFVDGETSPYHQSAAPIYQNGMPITGVRFSQVQKFCAWLSERPGEILQYRLPTREEWVCAYRAGTETPFYWGESFLAGKCNSPIGAKKPPALELTNTLPPNPWKLYHMAGNVAELLSDGQSSRRRTLESHPTSTALGHGEPARHPGIMAPWISRGRGSETSKPRRDGLSRGFHNHVRETDRRTSFVNTTKKSSQYQRDRAIAENQYATLSLGLNLKTRQPVLIRDFKPGILASESQWAGFRELLEERRQTHVTGMLRVAGVGGTLKQPYLVITGTTGQSLRNALAKSDSSDLTNVVESLKPAGLGLDSLHELGYVHGDVRPDTLFFDTEGNLLLNELTTHYALCGWSRQSHVMEPRFFGSVFPTSYLAPEVRSGGPLDSQSDQYALGLVLFEACTGIPPRDNINIAEMLAGANVKPARQTLLAKLRPVLERALSVEPRNRYPNCQAMLASAEEQLQSSSVKKWVWMGLGVAGALGVFAILFSWLSSQGHLPGEEAWKAQARQEIERQYQAEIPLVQSATAKFQSSPTETSAVGPILEEVRSKLADQQLGALKSRLKSVSLEILAQPKSPAFQFLYSANSTGILYLDNQKAAPWKAVLTFDEDLPEEELSVRVELYDVDNGSRFDPGSDSVGRKQTANSNGESDVECRVEIALR